MNKHTQSEVIWLEEKGKSVRERETGNEEERTSLRAAAREVLEGGAARAIMAALAEKARAGDLKCAEFIRDMAGEKPPAKAPEPAPSPEPSLSWDEKMDLIRRLRNGE